MEWRVLGRHASDPSAPIYALQHHPKPALRDILWNGFRETRATVPGPKFVLDMPISGVG